MTKLALALSFIASCLAQQISLRFTGAITGTLKGDDGSAIVGGSVSMALLPPHPKRLPRTDWTTITATGGTFRFSGLIDGRYRLCAQVAKSTWLNPCEWGLERPVVTLSASQPVSNLTIVMRKGAAVPIRVDDSGGLLPRHAGKTPGAHLLIGIGNDASVFVPATLLAQDSTGSNYQVVVPFNSPVKLVVRSSFFQLADAAGVPLPSTGAAIPLTVPIGQAAATVRLRVIGGGGQ